MVKKNERWEIQFWRQHTCSSIVQNAYKQASIHLQTQSCDMFSVSETRMIQQAWLSRWGACIYWHLQTRGVPSFWGAGCIIMIHASLRSLRAVVNPVGTCLELPNQLELKSAQMGGDKQAGGVVTAYFDLTGCYSGSRAHIRAWNMKLSPSLIRGKIFKSVLIINMC